MLAILLVAASLGLSNFAAAIGHAARCIGAALLIATGLYTLISAYSGHARVPLVR
jgi:hypothetical protein